MDSVKDPWLFITGVAPFGNPRVKVYFRLTAAYRRLSRPSSALSAKAFTLRSFSLEQPSCSLSSLIQKLHSSFYCLSFANNCSLGCEFEKTILVFFLHVLSASEILSFLRSWRNCFFTLDWYGKTYFCFNNKFFSIYNYLFRFFLYSVFNEHVEEISTGRPKWTRTTDLVLIRHAL